MTTFREDAKNFGVGALVIGSVVYGLASAIAGVIWFACWLESLRTGENQYFEVCGPIWGWLLLVPWFIGAAVATFLLFVRVGEAVR